MEKLKVTLEDRPIDRELAQYKRMFEAAVSALAAICDALGVDPEEGGAEPILAAIADLKDSGSRPVNQEPVFRCANCECIYSEKVTQCDCMPDVQEWIEGTMSFNAAPVRTKDLTDDEIADVFRVIRVKESWSLDFARAVIAAYKEKNHG